MVRILLTGMSGVGKSTVLRKLQSENSLTIDLDDGDWMYFDDRANDFLMDIPKLKNFMKMNSDKHIFLAGTASNQSRLYVDLDCVIALTAPLSVMKERIKSRTDNPFGKSETEWEKIEKDTMEFEERIKKSSDYVIDTSQPLEDTVKKIERLIQN